MIRALLLLACTAVSGGGVAVAAPAVEATVSLDELAAGTLRVELVIADPGGEVRRLWGVPAWMDNPLPEARGEVVRALRVRRDGSDVPVTFARTSRGEPVWDLEPGPGILEVGYTLRVDFVAGEMVRNYAVRLPSMDADRAWLNGNVVFLTPGFGSRRVSELRRPIEVRVVFDLPEDVPLFGPPSVVRLHDLYELLSLQFGLGRFEQMELPGPGWTARLFFADAQAFSRDERVWLAGGMRAVAREAVGLFGGAPFEGLGLFAFRKEGFGGLEGAWAAQAYLPADVDLADPEDPRGAVFMQVAAHELVHTWLPIALFGLDDPWLKEGVTSHYGNVIAARAGWLDEDGLDGLFSRYGEAELEAVALGDPRIWYREYEGESWRRLTYDRGHAVALLLDVHLREATGNRRSLDDVLRRLYREHAHGAFDRAELLATIEAATGVDPAGFFARYVDTTTPPDPAEVADALRRARDLGVYSAR